MGTKVVNIKKHNITYPDNNDGLPQMVKMHLPVVEGKIVLVIISEEQKLDGITGDLFISEGRIEECRGYYVSKKKGHYCKPIIISESETVEIGDWQINHLTNKISRRTDSPLEVRDVNCSKILVLPEHFSDKDLQAIAHGELKNGDTVLIECNMVNHPESLTRVEHYYKWKYEIKHDSQGYVLLHNVDTKPKMYTRDEVIDKIYKYHNWIESKDRSKYKDSNEWLEKNI